MCMWCRATRRMACVASSGRAPSTPTPPRWKRRPMRSGRLSMADTKWCPSCGAEYRASVTKCAECAVDLVDTPPPAPAAAPERELTEPGEALEYDLTDWDDEAREGLEWMLRGRDVAFEWERRGILVVAESDEEVVDGFIDYLSAGPPDEEPVVAAEPPPAVMRVDEFYVADPRRHAYTEVEFGW